MDGSNHFYIHNARIVNEGKIFAGDILIQNGKIARIMGRNSLTEDVVMDPRTEYVDATGCILLPGGIDEHVHFRDPGLTHKGDFVSESRAAVAGGICTVMDMPNTVPQTTTNALWEEKQASAEGRMFTNYAFYLGATNGNFEEIRNADPNRVAGIKLFLGSSTGNMLLSDDTVLERLFKWQGLPFAAHCEDEGIIRNNLAAAKEQYGENVPFRMHPQIRSAEACLLSTKKAVEAANKYNAPLHILHVSTAQELELLTDTHPEITMEVCPSYLFFCDEDYDRLGCRMKCNPAIKGRRDREALLKALQQGRIRCAGSDHAPHTWEEKDKPYLQSPSGMPMVAHTMPLLLELVWENRLKLAQVPELLSHNPAKLFRISNKGFIREGYDADLVIVEEVEPETVTRDNLPYRCGWSPLEGKSLHYRIRSTFVNGKRVYHKGKFAKKAEGQPLHFER
jgi:dihydroorotase